VLIYDGDCGICNQSADWARAHLPSGDEVVPWQSVPDLAALGLTTADVESAAYWVDDDGTLHRGEAAASAVLRRVGGGWGVAGTVLESAVVRPLARRAYYWVAANRHRLSRDGACSVEEAAGS
jgi:predicted DCC family thiol-disulfide oxidoreductase YuxK